MLFAPAVTGFTYNGHDYFVRQSLDNIDISPLAFSSDKGFALVSAGGSVKQAYKAVPVQSESEAYRYLGKNNTGSSNAEIDFVLNKDGTGSALSRESSPLKAVDFSINWSEDGNIISMIVYWVLHIWKPLCKENKSNEITVNQ